MRNRVWMKVVIWAVLISMVLSTIIMGMTIIGV